MRPLLVLGSIVVAVLAGEPAVRADPPGSVGRAGSFLAGPSGLGTGDGRSRRMPGTSLGSYAPLQEDARRGPVWSAGAVFVPILHYPWTALPVAEPAAPSPHRPPPDPEVSHHEERQRDGSWRAPAAAPPQVVVVVESGGVSRGGGPPARQRPAVLPAPEDTRPARVRIEVVPSDAEVRLDGFALEPTSGGIWTLELRPGVHLLEASGPGESRRRTAFGVAPAGDLAVRVDLGREGRIAVASSGESAPFRAVDPASR